MKVSKNLLILAPIITAAWNPHHSQQIVASGVSKCIKLLDLRSLKIPGMSSIKWKVSNAHQGTIRSVKMHPLIPYVSLNIIYDSGLHQEDQMELLKFGILDTMEKNL